MGRDSTDGRSPGRPRDAAIDETILRATVDLMVERGLEATTIQAVSDRTGIARATIYLRWPGRSALLLAALRWAMNRPAIQLTGEIESDLHRGAEQTRALLAQDTFVAALPTLMETFIREDGPAGVTFDTLFPGRRRLIEAYRAAAIDQGYRADADPAIAIDMIIGGLLLHLMTTGKAPTRAYGRQVVELVLAGLRLERNA